MSQHTSLSCKELINTAVESLNLHDISLEFYPQSVIEQAIEQGSMGNLVYMHAMSDTEEEKIYNNLPDEEKTSYRTKSAKIFFPDVSVDYFIRVLKCDKSGMYDRTCEIANESTNLVNTSVNTSVNKPANTHSNIAIACPIEIKCILFIFLHEVGHWVQLSKKFDWRIKEYADWNAVEEKQSFDQQQLVFLNRESPSGLTHTEKAELERLQKKYRQIPKEANADDFAKKKLGELLGGLVECLERTETAGQAEVAEQLAELPNAYQKKLKNMIDAYNEEQTARQKIEQVGQARLAEQRKFGEHGEIRVKKVGRNEPCPCGSGKKYKFCHGK